MIEVIVHGIEAGMIDTGTLSGWKTVDYSGEYRVTATVRFWDGLKLIWMLEEQQFTFYSLTGETFETYEKLIKGFFKND